MSEGNKILFRHLPRHLLQIWGTSEMPLAFKGLLSMLFLRLGGKPHRIEETATVGKILTCELTNICQSGSLASVRWSGLNRDLCRTRDVGRASRRGAVMWPRYHGSRAQGPQVLSQLRPRDCTEGAGLLQGHVRTREEPESWPDKADFP